MTPVQKEYARLARHYDERWSFYVRTTTCATAARLDLKPGDKVLDVGCGTGALLCQLSGDCPRMSFAGVDPSPEMLAVARQRLPETVELKEGWAERIPFGDSVFDVVVCCNVFHYIRQPLAAIADMLRVLKPAGRLVITDWCDDYLACRLCDLYLRIFNDAHYRVYGRNECLSLLKQTAVRDASVERYKINWLWGLMTARATKAGA